MKIALYFFSGTGNTKRIADLYISELSALGHEVAAHELPKALEAFDQAEAEAADIIGIGYPIHAFNAPKVVQTLVKKLPKRDKAAEPKPTFLFKTSGEPVRMNDTSSLKLMHMLRQRGYIALQEYHYVMPYNIIFRHTDEQAYKMWSTAQALVPIDVKELLSGETHLPKKLFLGGFWAWWCRIEHPGARINGVFFRADKKCIRCGMCIKACPAGNIYLNKKGKIKFGNKCMMCMRCSMSCPKDAVHIGLFASWKVNGKYSFARPEPDAAQEDKHKKYCKKAYDRYYATAEARIAAGTALDGDKTE